MNYDNDIKENEAKKLLEIIPNYPKINIFHINDFSSTLPNIIDNFSKDKNYEYDLFYLYNEEINPKIASNLNIKQARFNKHSKLYDFVFISSNLDNRKDKKIFFKKIYHICKNGAKIILFLKEKNYNLEQMLEDLNFVAFNYIEISNNYKILSFQKMHGWGVYDLK